MNVKLMLHAIISHQLKTGVLNFSLPTCSRSRTCVSPAFGGVRTCPDEEYQEEVIGQNCNPTTCPS